ncbi:MAG: hypothetical protein ACW97V_15515 [Promethearchaeota archaeon]|jgi:hypothetical protein
MVASVYHIDWILVDTIIIILLFVLLIGVKIFKSTHRWRQNYSNEFLDFCSYPSASKLFRGEVLKTKGWNMTRDVSLIKDTKNSKPILLLGGYYKKKLVKVLTEGLCSYGFNVINLKLRVKRGSSSAKLEELISAEIQTLVSMVINFFDQESLFENSGYLILDCSRAVIPIRAYLSDRTNIKIISINPKICKRNPEEIGDIINLSQNVFYIFSLRSLLFLRNKSVTRIYKNYPKEDLTYGKITVLDKSNGNFKYYETILLGIIIDKIKNS